MVFENFEMALPNIRLPVLISSGNSSHIALPNMWLLFLAQFISYCPPKHVIAIPRAIHLILPFQTCDCYSSGNLSHIALPNMWLLFLGQFISYCPPKHVIAIPRAIHLILPFQTCDCYSSGNSSHIALPNMWLLVLIA